MGLVKYEMCCITQDVYAWTIASMEERRLSSKEMAEHEISQLRAIKHKLETD